jgi:hypothetical protein
MTIENIRAAVDALIKCDITKDSPYFNDKKEFARRGHAIELILEDVERKFGLEWMLQLFEVTCGKLGHILCPVSSSIVKKLIENGFEIKVGKCLQYDK